MVVAQISQVWPGAALVPAEFDIKSCADAELAARSARGDTEAFAEVYRRHGRRVYGLCLRMVRRHEEAEDLTHEVFLHLHRAIGSFRGESSFTTWLHRLTTNHVLMHFRRLKPRKGLLAAENDQGDLRAAANLRAVTGSPSPDAVALELAVEQLPPGYRAVFILHDVEGYEHDEIARMLGVATGTSKSQLHKARMRLRKLLGAARAGKRTAAQSVQISPRA